MLVSLSPTLTAGAISLDPLNFVYTLMIAFSRTYICFEALIGMRSDEMRSLFQKGSDARCGTMKRSFHPLVTPIPHLFRSTTFTSQFLPPSHLASLLNIIDSITEFLHNFDASETHVMQCNEIGHRVLK